MFGLSVCCLIGAVLDTTDRSTDLLVTRSHLYQQFPRSKKVGVIGSMVVDVRPVGIR